MSQSLKHLPEVISYIKQVERRLENLVSEVADVTHILLEDRREIFRRLDYLTVAVSNVQCTEFKEKLGVDIGVARALVAENRTTLAVERHGHADWLVATDGNGQNELLAVFVGDEQVAMFTRALALAKASAHAMGQSGI